MMSNQIPQDINKLFTERAREAIRGALNIASNMKHGVVRDEHLMYGILTQKESLVANVLLRSGLKIEIIFQTLNQNKLVETNSLEPKFSEELKDTLLKAFNLARGEEHKFVGTEHLALAVLEKENTGFVKTLKKSKLDIEKFQQIILGILGKVNNLPEITRAFDAMHQLGANLLEGMGSNKPGAMQAIPEIKVVAREKQDEKEGKKSALQFFTTNLSVSARKGRLDPVIGRQDEIDRVINILNRKTKNNPVLIGEPGVGKTAIVSGLAQKIEDGEVNENLIGKEVLVLDVASLVAGSGIRGEFEMRIKEVLEEAKQRDDVILFIDEIHNIVGTGSAQGSMDAANILKPALSLGEIQCIGATTLGEYRKNIEKDPALERRFQSVTVEPSSKEDTLKILKGLREAYEKYHHLSISDEALIAAVYLSDRYIQDRFLPDKAIDLIDEAAAFRKGNTKISGILKKLKMTKLDLSDLSKAKQDAIENEKYTEALSFKSQEEVLSRRMADLIKKRQALEGSEKAELSREDISRVVAKITKVPLEKLKESEIKKINKFEKILSNKIVGQKEAIFEVARALKRSRAGINNPKRPLGSFIFLGPTGVGKTELAKTIAKEFYEDENALVKLDMSEFSERHTVSRLIGAPAGYIGYEEGGKLTEIVRRKPYSIILLDEIEKAHPEVFNILLQILEDGYLTDATGRQVNFRNTIIVMTSNIGTQELTQNAELGFKLSKKEKEGRQAQENQLKSRIREELKEYIRPELLGRIDKILIFNALDKKEIKKIVELQLKELEEELKEKGIRIKVTKEAIDWISEKGFNPSFGARPIRKKIQDTVYDQIADRLVSGKVGKGSEVKIKVKKDKIVVE